MVVSIGIGTSKLVNKPARMVVFVFGDWERSRNVASASIPSPREHTETLHKSMLDSAAWGRNDKVIPSLKGVCCKIW